MCIVIDACVFGSVFNPEAKHFHKYEPVFNWLFNTKNKKIKLVYGGSTYFSEIGKSTKYLDILTQLNRKGKTKALPSNKIDELENKIRKELPFQCDDPHLVAIFVFSKCLLFCSEDKRSLEFIKDSKFYEGKYRGPKLYKDRRNKKILNDKNIAKICIEH